MKRLLTILLAVSGVCFLPVAMAETPAAKPGPRAKSNVQSLDKMVAVINDDVITQSELNHAINNTRLQLTQERAAIPTDDALRKQVLEQLINKKVQLQMAKTMGIQVTDTELDKAIRHIAEQNNMTPQDMYSRINQDGMTTTEYRNEMRSQMIMQRLQQQEVASRITISPHELSNFIRSHTWQMNRSKEYHLQDILIPVSDTPSPQELSAAKKRANEILAQLKHGTKFEDVAQTDSSGSNALQGGDLGWRKIAEIPSAFSERVTSMKDNQLSGPIQTPNGYHIIRLLGVRTGEGHQPKPDRKVIESLLLQQKFEEAVQNWVSKIRGQAFIITNTQG